MASSLARPGRAALCLIVAASLAACGRGPDSADGKAPAAGTPAGAKPGAAAGAPPGAPPPAAVGVVTVQSGPVPLATELPGRVEAWRVAQVRARAAGIVQKRLFEEGSDVRAGQVLYKIDPAPLQAGLANATAQLRRAEAALSSAKQKEARYRPLVATKAVSEQEFADLVSQRELAEAEVNAAKAARETAQLSLSYADVTAPISGRVGRSLVTEGALVGQGEATPLTTIQQLDPVYLNLTQSSAEYLRLRRALTSGSAKATESAEVKLVLEDGTPYPATGKLLFADVTIDPNTSSVTLRATVPNPQRLLLPGMYLRAQVAQAVDTKAWRVPQQAVVRRGDAATVFVVGPDDKVAIKPVKTAGTTGMDWIVTEGLADGDRVIVDGLQKIGPGAPVRPVPWQAPGTVAPAAQAAANAQAGGNAQAATGNAQAAANPQAATGNAQAAGGTQAAGGNTQAAGSGR